MNTTLHNDMILSTLSISSRGFVLGFSKMSRTNVGLTPNNPHPFILVQTNINIYDMIYYTNVLNINYNYVFYFYLYF